MSRLYIQKIYESNSVLTVDDDDEKRYSPPIHHGVLLKTSAPKFFGKTKRWQTNEEINEKASDQSEVP